MNGNGEKKSTSERKKCPSMCIREIQLICHNVPDNCNRFIRFFNVFFILHFTVILQSSDFDFLLTKGGPKHTHKSDPRCSLLLRFDPLVNRDVAVANRQSTLIFPSKSEQRKASSAEPLLSLTVSGENENLSETLPLPELGQQSAPNSSAEDITPVNIVQHQYSPKTEPNHGTSITNEPTAIVNSVSSGLHLTADTTFTHPVVSY